MEIPGRRLCDFMLESRTENETKKMNKSGDEKHKKRWEIMQNKTNPAVFRHTFSAT